MQNVTNNGRVRATNNRGGEPGYGVYTPLRDGTRDSYVYASKVECYKTLTASLVKYFTTGFKKYTASYNYTSDFNSWLMSSGFMYYSDQTKNWAKNGYRGSYFERLRTIRWKTGEGILEIQATGGDAIGKEANNKSCFEVLKQIVNAEPSNRVPCVQMTIPTLESNQEGWDELDDKALWLQWWLKEKRRGWDIPYCPRISWASQAVVQMETPDKTTEQGDVTQESDKQINTIVTRDQQEADSIHNGALDSVDKISSSEPEHVFPSITQRWMPLGSLEWSTSGKSGDILKTYYLPEDMYKDKCAPSLNPFETFIYGRMDIEMRIVINGNKFCCGKLLLSSKYDTYQADKLQDGTASALNRPHVIVDASTNNEGILVIPFRFHRPFIRLVKNDKASLGVRPSKYASVYLHILSPLATGKDGNTMINVRLFFRFTSSSFTGMSYRVAIPQMDTPVVQGFGLEDVVTPRTAMALKEVLGGAERAFDQIGRSRNQDKPSTVTAIATIPRPRLGFAGGKGVTDVVPLRVNPHTLTNYAGINPPRDEPKSFYDLARIWSIYGAVTWNATDKEGTEICDIVIDPASRSYTADSDTEFTTLEYAMSNFMFWTGTIEMRVDFVSNSFHTGAVQLSAEFGRITSTSDICESSSTYTKVFHLGDQKTVSFRIPYIYDTVMRRTTAGVYDAYTDATTSDTLKQYAPTIAPLSQTHFKVRVMNVLRPPSTAPQSIELLLFIRAGKNFRMHGLKGTSNLVRTPAAMDYFPRDYSATVPTATRVRRDANKTPVPVKVIKPLKDDTNNTHRLRPKELANEWNEIRSDKLARVQMDTGSKEDQDETDNFNQGASTVALLTLDNHMNFKDLLRRPTLLIWGGKASLTNTGGYFIPLQPPNRQMALVSPNSTNGIWAPTLSQTTAVNIMDMFRVWRGGMRYTIVVTKGTKPIYVSLLPHSGVRIVGPHEPNKDQTLQLPMCGANLTTEILVPTVNPTLTVEVPYDTENTWTLTYDDDAQLNYSWRDKGDYNSGHLIITPKEDIEFDIWWSAGDDFDIANFYGIPKTKWNGWAYRFDDRHAKVQMDFQANETVTKVTSLCKRMMDPRVIGRAAIGAIPLVGTPLVVADTATYAEEKIGEVTDAAKNTLGSIGNVAQQWGVATEHLAKLVSESIEKITGTITGLVHGASLLYDVVLDILVAWMERSWRVVGVGIVRFLTKLIAVPTLVYETILSFSTQFANLMEGLFTQHTPVVQADVNHGAIYVGLLAGVIGTITGVHLNPTSWTASFGRNMMSRLTSVQGVAYLVHVLNFVKTTFDTVKDMFMRALGYVSPEAQALRLLGENNPAVERFVREAQIITSESNSGMLSMPEYRRRVWYTVLQAHQLQRLMCKIPTNCVSYQLSKLCTDVIKMSNEKFLDMSASPVRFEPMVICLEGPPGTGKSHVTETLVDGLLDAIGYQARTSEKIFYRVAGERFWSGYRDQPVVVYDEWLPTTDSVRCIDQIAEMMKLKSTALFIPEMAHLEEKKVRGNPLIIILCCNNAFPNALSNYATCPRAVLRRRDVVLKVTRKEEFVGMDLKFPPEALKSKIREYGHLNFQRYSDVVNEKSIVPARKGFDVTSKWLTNQWKAYYEQEQEQVKIRMSRLSQYMDSMDGGICINDPFTLFYQLGVQVDRDTSTNMNGYTHYEALEVAMEIVTGALNQPEQRAEAPPTKLVSWEDAETLCEEPQTQMVGSIVVGCLIYGWVPQLISSAILPQLLRWEEEINPLRTESHHCSVCLDDEARCAYVCANTKGAATQHTVCASCYISMRQFHTSSCPVCRCDRMIPLLGKRDLCTFTVWTRICLLGNKGMQWLCDKFIRYFNWRRENVLSGLLCEFLMEVAYSFALTADPCVSLPEISQVLQYNRYAWIGTFFWENWNEIAAAWVPSTQIDTEPGTSEENENEVDDWGDIPILNHQPIPVQEEPVDHLDVCVNKDIIKTLLSGTEKGPCLHGRVMRNSPQLRIINGKWQIPDDFTQRMIEIPLNACESTLCHLRFDKTEEQALEAYSAVFQRYVTLHRNTLRHSMIEYYNTMRPSCLENIPAPLRPAWVQEYQPILTQSWWTYLSDTWTQYRNVIVYCGAAGAILASLYGAYSLMTTVSASTFALSQVSATAGSPEASSRSPRRTIDRQGRNRPVYFQRDVNDTPSIYEVAVRYISQNTFVLEIMSGTKTIRTMYGTGIFNHYLLMPRHYVKEIRSKVGEHGYRLFGNPILAPQLRSEIVLDFNEVIVSETTDLAYVMLPPKYPLFKDIRRFLAHDHDFDTPITSEGILLLNPKGSGQSHWMREHVVDIMGFTSDLIIEDADRTKFKVQDVIQYNYSQPGVCGSILLRENHQRPILSMHFAGDPGGSHGNGYGIPLTKEALGELCENRKSVPVQFEDVEYESIEDAKFIYDETIHLAYYGSVPKTKAPFLPTKSKLVPSLIKDTCGLTTIMEPAILSTSDARYIHQETPLYAGVKKHGQITLDFDPEIVHIAGEQYWDMFLSRMKPLCADPRELTLDQVICGIRLPHYMPVDLTTSAGYPLNLNTKRTQKQHYISVERDEHQMPIRVGWIDPWLESEIERKRELRRQGIVPHTLFCDTLKDEKRKSEKARSLGGTRVFCSSPVDYVIECRRYFMHFIAAFMEHRADLLHAVGINPTGPEWTTLLKTLMKKNGKVGTIDYSNFGPGYNAAVARKAYSLIVRWTMEHVRTLSGGTLDERELWCVVYECLQSMHICNNTVYQQGAGSPSGAVFTTPINTLVNILYVLIAWNILTAKHRANTPEMAGAAFVKNVALYCYGDDGIFSVTPEYEEIFNMRTITELFAQYKIVATNAAKTTDIRPFENVSEASFLKRGFLLHPLDSNYWLAPLAWESVVSSTQWVWQSENMKEATLVNASAALTEAWAHGPQRFEEFKNQLNRALRQKRMKPLVGTWKEYDERLKGVGFEFDYDNFILSNLY